MRRRIRTAVIAVIAVGFAAGVAGAASPIVGPALSDVPTANAKSAGFAPASKLSPELRQTAVAQGSTKVENPSVAISYYGYDNDVLTASGDPSVHGILGARLPNLWHDGWRWFYTQQHGDNPTYEVLPSG